MNRTTACSSTTPLRRRMMRTALLTAALLAGTAFGCTQAPNDFTEPLTFAGVEVSAERLNRGKEDYTTYCMQCHGGQGDGQGHAAPGLIPPPRNFQHAQFKFPAVEQGELPTDEELARIVRHGLGGTAMLEWDISDERLLDVIQYIKTFAMDDWADKRAETGEVLVVEPDPYGAARRDEAVAFGRKVYHGYARCYQCHPAYESVAQIHADTKDMLNMDQPVSLRANWHRTEAKDSSYGATDKRPGVKTVPPDFTWHLMRTVNPDWPLQQQTEQYYRIVAAGITGAAMPAWKQSMSNEYTWALAYYLQSLTELRDAPEREQFWADLGVDPTGDVPAVVPGAAS